jgi:hypothetical protein
MINGPVFFMLGLAVAIVGSGDLIVNLTARPGVITPPDMFLFGGFLVGVTAAGFGRLVCELARIRSAIRAVAT